MAAVGMALAAGGGMKSAKTTVLMTGEEGVAAMTKASAVTYAPKKLPGCDDLAFWAKLTISGCRPGPAPASAKS